MGVIIFNEQVRQDAGMAKPYGWSFILAVVAGIICFVAAILFMISTFLSCLDNEDRIGRSRYDQRLP